MLVPTNKILIHTHYIYPTKNAISAGSTKALLFVFGSTHLLRGRLRRGGARVGLVERHRRGGGRGRGAARDAPGGGGDQRVLLLHVLEGGGHVVGLVWALDGGEVGHLRTTRQ